MPDNELLVLIYETLQKQLNQFKDSRVIIQTVCDRMGALEKDMQAVTGRMQAIENRLSSMEEKIELVNSLNESHKKLTATVNAMRATIDTVVNPSITLIGGSNKEMKESVRNLSFVHKQVMDELEQYELRLVMIEDAIQKIITKQFIDTKDNPEENNDNE